MLIIEGTDIVGKTTLAKKLTHELSSFGHIYSHFTRLPDNFDRYWGYIEHARPNIVQDRFHMSELVYASARRDSTSLDDETYRLVDAYLRNFGSYTVVITATEELLKSRYENININKTQQMYDLHTVLSANEYFKEVAFCSEKYDSDLSICESEDEPWPTENIIQFIKQNYLERRLKIQSLLKRQARQMYQPQFLWPSKTNI